MWLTDQQKIGVGLVSGGLLFLVLGIVLFFDATLLALGNVLFLAGIALLIGPQKTLLFFARPQKIRGTVCFFAGMALVFVRWTVLGMMVELVGFLNLFGDFFPVILSFLRQMPLVGPLLSAPGVRQVMDQLAGARRSAV
ncbi:Homodimeric protein that is packaged into COPII vesicles [Malassezia sympodialis ATCC 42132]|uniref:Homodimeric protein that is packaged into COPII vesicles n=1 Tax=Malassezia sympodialis (strain ATCC 42132) TaxID=1230383 RepID=A0A1M8A3D0_MALS4|nr:Homodimeric protein that is packaged into COPII vesicles [Malassezia sympodialis ATCC 42132]